VGFEGFAEGAAARAPARDGGFDCSLVEKMLVIGLGQCFAELAAGEDAGQVEEGVGDRRDRKAVVHDACEVATVLRDDARDGPAPVRGVDFDRGL
jgi:hypothetical protein